MGSHIEVIARGVSRRGNSVLLCRNDKRGYLYLPGGHVEVGERAEDALVREFAEECGVKVSIGDLALTCEASFGQGANLVHEVNLVFHVEPLPDSLTVLSLEPGISFHWIDSAAIAGLDLRPDPIKAWLMSGGAGSSGWASGMTVKVDPRHHR